MKQIPLAKSRPHPGEYLGRMMKALIGAVYVDSGFSIQKTDDVFMPMFKSEIEVVYNKLTHNIAVQ